MTGSLHHPNKSDRHYSFDFAINASNKNSAVHIFVYIYIEREIENRKWGPLSFVLKTLQCGLL